MDKNTILIVAVLIALVAGFSGGYTVRGSSTPSDGSHMMPNGMMMGNNGMGMGNAMDDMMVGLSGKTGEAFDRAFLAEMIVHHEGAVSMAQAALQDAKHQEIKDLANAIISAQTTEIAQMKAWQKSWFNQ